MHKHMQHFLDSYESLNINNMLMYLLKTPIRTERMWEVCRTFEENLDDMLTALNNASRERIGDYRRIRVLYRRVYQYDPRLMERLIAEYAPPLETRPRTPPVPTNIHLFDGKIFVHHRKIVEMPDFVQSIGEARSWLINQVKFYRKLHNPHRSHRCAIIESAVQHDNSEQRVSCLNFITDPADVLAAIFPRNWSNIARAAIKRGRQFTRILEDLNSLVRVHIQTGKHNPDGRVEQLTAHICSSMHVESIRYLLYIEDMVGRDKLLRALQTLITEIPNDSQGDVKRYITQAADNAFHRLPLLMKLLTPTAMRMVFQCDNPIKLMGSDLLKHCNYAEGWHKHDINKTARRMIHRDIVAMSRDPHLTEDLPRPEDAIHLATGNILYENIVAQHYRDKVTDPVHKIRLDVYAKQLSTFTLTDQTYYMMSQVPRPKDVMKIITQELSGPIRPGIYASTQADVFRYALGAISSYVLDDTIQYTTSPAYNDNMDRQRKLYETMRPLLEFYESRRNFHSYEELEHIRHIITDVLSKLVHREDLHVARLIDMFRYTEAPTRSSGLKLYVPARYSAGLPMTLYDMPHTRYRLAYHPMRHDCLSVASFSYDDIEYSRDATSRIREALYVAPRVNGLLYMAPGNIISSVRTERERPGINQHTPCIVAYAIPAQDPILDPLRIVHLMNCLIQVARSHDYRYIVLHLPTDFHHRADNIVSLSHDFGQVSRRLEEFHGYIMSDIIGSRIPIDHGNLVLCEVNFPAHVLRIIDAQPDMGTTIPQGGHRYESDTGSF